jgi:hypothetical protein
MGAVVAASVHVVKLHSSSMLGQWLPLYKVLQIFFVSCFLAICIACQIYISVTKRLVLPFVLRGAMGTASLAKRMNNRERN